MAAMAIMRARSRRGAAYDDIKHHLVAWQRSKRAAYRAGLGARQKKKKNKHVYIIIIFIDIIWRRKWRRSGATQQHLA